MNFDALPWPDAPQWAIWCGTAGKGFVWSGVIAFALAALSHLFFASKPRLGKGLFWMGCLSAFAAFGCLGALLVNGQFEYAYVRETTQVGLELKYRIAAIWSKQQGSFLLWAVCSAIFGLLTVGRTGVYQRWYTVSYSAFLGSLCGILAFETPFNLTLSHGKALVPPDGAGMTPSLQNYWVVIHPPVIFLGFGALTMLFCWAISALIERNAKDWVRQVRPWALLTLAILGLGLCMGGFWAYETLGWGGFWAWDPVENVSFVPWLLVAAFTHGLIVQSAGKGWSRANLVLGALPFLSFVYGTYLTRSGVYTDVSNHSFATMDRNALKLLLVVLGAAFGVFGGVLAWRWKAFAEETPSPARVGVSRTAGYVAGTLILCGISLATAFGMSVPLIQFLQHQKLKEVEEPVYHQVMGWLVVPMLLLMATVPFLNWKGTTARTLFGKIGSAASFAFMFTGIAVFVMRHPAWGVGLTGEETLKFAFGAKIPTLPWIAFLLFLCFFTVCASFQRMVELRKASKLSLGSFVAHVGVAVTLAGLLVSRAFERKETIWLQPGETARGLGYAVEFKGFSRDSIEDRSNQAMFSVQGPTSKFTAKPVMYTVVDRNGQPNWVTWPHIERAPSHDLYLALQKPVLDVWNEPIMVKPGDTVAPDDGKIKVTYGEMTMHGQPGQPGTQFGAKLIIETPSGVYQAEPTVELSQGGLVPHLAKINDDLLVSMQGMDAGTKGALIQIHFSKPVYQIDMFYKPLTGLVWAGAGILFLGGLMSAAYRRRGAAPESEGVEEAPSHKSRPQIDDATLPAPQM